MKAYEYTQLFHERREGADGQTFLTWVEGRSAKALSRHLIEALNLLGAKGWQLVLSRVGPDGLELYLMRELGKEGD